MTDQQIVNKFNTDKAFRNLARTDVATCVIVSEALVAARFMSHKEARDTIKYSK